MGFNSGFKGLSSWGWAQSCLKHVEDSNKHIIEEIVRQVGYWSELYEDAQSEKYKKLGVSSMIHCKLHNVCVTVICIEEARGGASVSKRTKWPTGNHGYKIQ